MQAFHLINDLYTKLHTFTLLTQKKEGFDLKFTFVYQIQTFFVEHTTLLRKKNPLIYPSLKKEKEKKKKTLNDREWVTEIMGLLKKMITCYDDEQNVPSILPFFLCNLHNLFHLNYMLDHALFPIFSPSSVPGILQGVFLNETYLTHVLATPFNEQEETVLNTENDLSKLRRWIFLDITLHGLHAQLIDGFHFTRLTQTFSFPTEYLEIAAYQPYFTDPSQWKRCLMEATLRSYQSMQRLGEWIQLKKQKHPFKFWLFKTSLQTFLNPYLQSVLAFAFPYVTVPSSSEPLNEGKEEL
ncbi:hypothetical protein HMI54_008975 [Coelomomyces lativittatus]|nr:hypothetical protein HMI54_008975 [Coelomomyces lativittatus]